MIPINDEIVTQYELAYLYGYIMLKSAHTFITLLEKHYDKDHYNNERQEEYYDIVRNIVEVCLDKKINVDTLRNNNLDIQLLMDDGSDLAIILSDNVTSEIHNKFEKELEKDIKESNIEHKVSLKLEDIKRQINKELENFTINIFSSIFNALNTIYSPKGYITVIDLRNPNDILTYAKIYKYLLKSNTQQELFWIFSERYEEAINSNALKLEIQAIPKPEGGIPCNFIRFLFEELALEDEKNSSKKEIMEKLDGFIRNATLLDSKDAEIYLKIVDEMKKIKNNVRMLKGFRKSIESCKVSNFLKGLYSSEETRAQSTIAYLIELFYKVLSSHKEEARIKEDTIGYTVNLATSHLLTLHLYMCALLNGFLPIPHTYINSVENLDNYSQEDGIKKEELKQIGELDLLLIGVLPSRSSIEGGINANITFKPVILFIEATSTPYDKYETKKKGKLPILERLLASINNRLYNVSNSAMEYSICLIVACNYTQQNNNIASNYHQLIEYIDIKKMLNLEAFRRTILRVLLKHSSSTLQACIMPL